MGLQKLCSYTLPLYPTKKPSARGCPDIRIVMSVPVGRSSHGSGLSFDWLGVFRLFTAEEEEIEPFQPNLLPPNINIAMSSRRIMEQGCALHIVAVYVAAVLVVQPRQCKSLHGKATRHGRHSNLHSGSSVSRHNTVHSSLWLIVQSWSRGLSSMGKSFSTLPAFDRNERSWSFMVSYWEPILHGIGDKVESR